MRHGINFRPSPDHIPTRIGILLRQGSLFHPLRSPLMPKLKSAFAEVTPDLNDCRFTAGLPQKRGGLQLETTKHVQEKWACRGTSTVALLPNVLCQLW